VDVESIPNYLYHVFPSASEKRPVSACSSALFSTKKPCLSYRFLLLDLFKTTACNLEFILALRVNAAMPAGKKTKWPKSAHSRHKAPLSFASVLSDLGPSSSPHSAQVDSRDAMNTIISPLDFFTILPASTFIDFSLYVALHGISSHYDSSLYSLLIT
jgi:hypothetical protein